MCWSILDEAYLIDEWTHSMYRVVIFLPQWKQTVTLEDTVQSSPGCKNVTES